MMIPCLWSLLFGFDALTGVGWKGAPAAASFLVDIPRGLGDGIWRKRPYGLRLRIFPQPLGGALKNPNAAPTTPPCFGHWPRSSSLLFAPCTVLLGRALVEDATKKPLTKVRGSCFGGALSTALEPHTSSREMVLESSVKLKLSTTRSSKT